MAKIKKDDHVVYQVSSGFCALLYTGRVVRANSNKSLVKFDEGQGVEMQWIENEYLLQETGGAR